MAGVDALEPVIVVGGLAAVGESSPSSFHSAVRVTYAGASPRVEAWWSRATRSPSHAGPSGWSSQRPGVPAGGRRATRRRVGRRTKTCRPLGRCDRGAPMAAHDSMIATCSDHRCSQVRAGQSAGRGSTRPPRAERVRRFSRAVARAARRRDRVGDVQTTEWSAGREHHSR